MIICFCNCFDIGFDNEIGKVWNIRYLVISLGEFWRKVFIFLSYMSGIKKICEFLWGRGFRIS